MKTNENQWKSMKTNEHQWKPMENNENNDFSESVWLMQRPFRVLDHHVRDRKAFGDPSEFSRNTADAGLSLYQTSVTTQKPSALEVFQITVFIRRLSFEDRRKSTAQQP